MNKANRKKHPKTPKDKHYGKMAARRLPTNLSAWQRQFKDAIAIGNIPEGDLFEGIDNRFDAKEWK